MCGLLIEDVSVFDHLRNWRNETVRAGRVFQLASSRTAACQMLRRVYRFFANTKNSLLVCPVIKTTMAIYNRICGQANFVGGLGDILLWSVLIQQIYDLNVSRLMYIWFWELISKNSKPIKQTLKAFSCSQLFTKQSHMNTKKNDRINVLLQYWTLLSLTLSDFVTHLEVQQSIFSEA